MKQTTCGIILYDKAKKSFLACKSFEDNDLFSTIWGT